jgi:phosphohistidine swiveling domain-containing protein
MSLLSIIAKDARSPLVRNEIWTHLGDVWSKLFDIPRPIIGILSRKNTIEYLIELESWGRARTILRARIEKDPEELKKILDLSEGWGAEMNAFTEAIHGASLATWSAQDLIDAYRAFADFQSREYGVGALLPLLDIGGESFLETFVRSIIDERVEDAQKTNVYRILTTPNKNSFSLDQEEALLTVASELFQDKSISDILDGSSPEAAWQAIEASHEQAADKIRAHAKTYGWVYYVYEGPAFHETHFVEFLQSIRVKKIDAKTQLTTLEKERKVLIEQQREWIDRLGKDEKERNLLALTSEFVWSKPRRKDYQSRSYYHMESFFREWSRRVGVSLRHARSATMKQLEKGLEGKPIDLRLLESQHQVHIVTNMDGQVCVYVGQEAESFAQEWTVAPEKKAKEDVKSLQGSTAYPGEARGRVRVVNGPEDMKGFKPGEILVAIATTPSIVPAMKKAGAILTDEGGLTCHAAIVSRELKVPCVVGLKIVTDTLTNGDEVEVDAVRGIVNILKRANKNHP